ncbi:MAG: carbonic anhydrase [Psychroserpens sp.]|uniref:carbonic anhydrase n=1 Tax=Psychroserpens sp. TaxID=2020870 RepID=UPI003C76EA1E
MKKLMYLLVFSVLCSVNAQSDEIKKLLKVQDNTYFADRDSAYLDPYYGLKKLMYGNKRFVDNRRVSPRQSDEDLKNSSLGQKPFATIIGCADSRVPNEMIFDQGVGDLFITRTAGQVMAEASYGTIEYATVALNTKLIVVLGHESCGAVTAAMKLPENPPGHVVTLINSIKPATLKAIKEGASEKEQLDITVEANVLEQVKLLRGLEPVLSRKFEKGEILIVGAVYKLSTGKVEFIEETILSLPKFKSENKKSAP